MKHKHNKLQTGELNNEINLNIRSSLVLNVNSFSFNSKVNESTIIIVTFNQFNLTSLSPTLPLPRSHVGVTPAMTRGWNSRKKATAPLLQAPVLLSSLSLLCCRPISLLIPAN